MTFYYIGTFISNVNIKINENYRLSTKEYVGRNFGNSLKIIGTFEYNRYTGLSVIQ